VFGMGTGVAPPLSPPEFRCCLAAFPEGTGTKAYSIVAGVASSGLFAKQVPANKAKRQLTADAWSGGSGHSEHRQNPQELRCHHPRPHNQALRLPLPRSAPKGLQARRPCSAHRPRRGDNRKRG
jgi:hypothetical protein